MAKKKLKVNRGAAIPLGNDYFLMRGATHEQGGIDVGKDLEVENGEIIKVNPKSIKILSNAPIMNGISPAQMALGGLDSGNFEERFNRGFKYQEKYKDINNLNDDGTKKKMGGKKKLIGGDETTKRWDKALYSGTPSATSLEDIKDRDKYYIESRNNILYNENSPKKIIKAINKLNEEIANDNSLIENHKNVLIGDNEHVIKYPISHAVKARSDRNWKYRDKIDEKNIIGYNPDKFIRLTNAGKSTGVGLSTNILDTLAFHAGRADIPLIDALAIAAQETTFGKYHGTSFLNDKNDYDMFYTNSDPDSSQEAFITYNGVRPTELVNNHHYFNQDPYQSLIGEVSRQTGKGHTPTQGFVDANIEFNDFDDKVEAIMRKGFNYAIKQSNNYNLDTHPLDDAFELYKTGKYNLGIPNNNELIIQRGKELMNSPEINQWLENSGQTMYEKGKMRIGGTISKKLNKVSEKTKTDLIKRATGNYKKEDIVSFNGGDFGGAGASGNWWERAKSIKLKSRQGYSSTGGKKKAFLGIDGYPLSGATVAAKGKQLPDLNLIRLKANDPGIIVPKQTHGLYNLGEFPTLDVPKYLEAPTGGLAIPQGYDKTGFKLPQNNTNEKISIWKANPNLAGNIIQGVANIGAATISGLVNRGMLNDLQYKPQPALLQSSKLKTNYNINPQIREIKNTLNNYRRLIDKNTASSQVALARSRHGYVNALENLLGLNAQKENIETQLINQDIMNQQEVANKNIINYDNWLAGKYDFENAIREKRSENVISGIQAGTQAISDFITNNAKWKESMANIAALSAAYPNVTPERMAASGIYYPLYMKQRIAKAKRRR